MSSNPTPPKAPTRPRRRTLLRLFFGLILALMIMAGVTAIITIGERRAAAIIAENKDFAKSRLILMGAAEGEGRYFHDVQQKVVPQPYLLYVPAPGLKENDHNEHGYRGPIVPVFRQPGKIRILFIGGSTIYGWGVYKAEETYPLRLAELLRLKLPAGVNDVEVINAGLPFGTSAEHLTHYLFKFRYYHPDIVVLECGGNDTNVEHRSYYQPDYSHWRQQIATIKPLPPQYQYLMKSQMFSLFMINCIQPDFLVREAFINTDHQTPPLVGWFHPYSHEVYQPYGYPRSYSGFYNNVRAFIREVLADGSKPLIVPFAANPFTAPEVGYHPTVVHDILRNQDILQSLAADMNVPIVNIDPKLIPEADWSDPWCHLLPEGEKLKAQQVLPALDALVQQTTPRPEPPRFPPPKAYSTVGEHWITEAPPLQ